jgi:chaperone modulatory protein CbpM
MAQESKHIVYGRYDGETLETFVSAGWLYLDRDETCAALSEANRARAELICDLKRDMGVNDEGVDVILDLLDQIHGLRHALRRSLGHIRKD